MAAGKSLFIFMSYLFTFCVFYGSSYSNKKCPEPLFSVDDDSMIELDDDLDSEVPTVYCKPNPWHQIVASKKLELFDVHDWRRHEAVIPYLPEQYGHRVNLSEAAVSILGKHKLKETLLRKFAEIVEEGKPNVLQEHQELLKLGNIFCGFSELHMTKIKAAVLRSLLHNNFFLTVKGCDEKKLRVLLKILQKNGVVGPPKSWDPETVTQLGVLVSVLEPDDFKKLRVHSMSRLKPEVIRLMAPQTLKGIYIDQLKSLPRESLLQWRRSTKDTRSLYAKSTVFPPSLKLLMFSYIMPRYVSLNV